MQKDEYFLNNLLRYLLKNNYLSGIFVNCKGSPFLSKNYSIV